MEERTEESDGGAARVTPAAQWSIGDATTAETGVVSGKRRRASGAKKASSKRRKTTEKTEKGKAKKESGRKAKSETGKTKKASSRKTSKTESGKAKKESGRKTGKSATGKAKKAAKKTTKKSTARKTTSKRKSARRGGLLEIIREILAAKLSGKENPILGPIIEHLTRGGLPADASQAVTAFALGKLTSALIADTGAPEARAGGALPAEAPGAGLGALVERVTGDQRVDKEFVASSGLAAELSRQAGLDPELAADSLAQAFNLLRRVASG